MPEMPGTAQVSITVTPIKPGEEIFSFHIINPTNPCYLKEFIELLDDHLPEIILPKDVIVDHQNLLAAGMTQEDILTKARGFLQKTTIANMDASGELGQVLLHLFAGKVLKANKLVSKFYRRESPTAPYRGLDSLYGYQDETGNIYMLAGEAKLHPDPNDGLRNAHTDLSGFWSNENEFSLEASIAAETIRHELSDGNIDLYRSYFIRDNPNHQALKYKNIILVGYNSTAFTSLVANTISAADFNQSINNELTRCFTNQRGIIEAGDKPSVYCFLPLEAVNSARELFARHNDLII